MDWSPYKIKFSDSPKKTEVLCFSYILSYSRRQYIDFTLDRNFYTLIRRHKDAFKYFDGVAEQCLYDNEKTVALRWEASRPVFNPAFIEFITHYQCRPVLCKPRSPKTKGKVEAPFKYVESNFLNARQFRNLQDIRSMAVWWLQNRSDTHIHDTTRRAPIELFMQDEQSELQPLPAHHYDCSEIAYRVCRMDGFLEFQGNLYSLPYEYIGDIIVMKASNEIFIYGAELTLIARHERIAAGAGRKIENPLHRGSKKVRYGLEPIRELFLQIGDAAESFLQGLKQQHPRNCGFHARYILGLKQDYHCDDINNALKHAVSYYAFDGQSVQHILRAKSKPRTLESIRNEQAGQELLKALPLIKQRPLEEYTNLLLHNRQDDYNAKNSNRQHSDNYQRAPEDSETDNDTQNY